MSFTWKKQSCYGNPKDCKGKKPEKNHQPKKKQQKTNNPPKDTQSKTTTYNQIKQTGEPGKNPGELFTVLVAVW